MPICSRFAAAAAMTSGSLGDAALLSADALSLDDVTGTTRRTFGRCG